LTWRVRRAFTLVELLIAVSIIALLIAVLVPSLRGARAQAKQAVCLSNMRSIGLATSMYADENLDRYPLSAHHSQDALWLRSLQPYAGNTLLFRCPSDRSADWFDPRDSAAEQIVNDRKASYGINIYFSPELAPPPGAPDPTPLYGYVRRGLVKRAIRAVHFGEFVQTSGMQTYSDHIHADQWLPNALTGVPLSAPEDEIAMERHRGRANYTFADGHAETLAFEETFEWDEATSKVITDFWNPKFPE
jgi:prepilin-type processing-associated H-X9-DG protein/prepilin-type N-terminal cleavage/methylation domain-containing protein